MTALNTETSNSLDAAGEKFSTSIHEKRYGVIALILAGIATLRFLIFQILAQYIPTVSGRGAHVSTTGFGAAYWISYGICCLLSFTAIAFTITTLARKNYQGAGLGMAIVGAILALLNLETLNMGFGHEFLVSSPAKPLRSQVSPIAFV